VCRKVPLLGASRQHEPRVAAAGAAHLEDAGMGLSRVEVAPAAGPAGLVECRIRQPSAASHHPIRRLNPAIGLASNVDHNG
jgi:hypothetical protein